MSKIRKLEQLEVFENKCTKQYVITAVQYCSTVTQLQNSMAMCNSNDIAAEKDCQYYKYYNTIIQTNILTIRGNGTTQAKH